MRSEYIHEQEIIEKQKKRCYLLLLSIVGDSHYWSEQKCWIENEIKKRGCNSSETNIATDLQSSSKAFVQKQQSEDSIQEVFILQIGSPT
jgi:hypothetical protein